VVRWHCIRIPATSSSSSCSSGSNSGRSRRGGPSAPRLFTAVAVVVVVVVVVAFFFFVTAKGVPKSLHGQILRQERSHLLKCTSKRIDGISKKEWGEKMKK
jgi:hypothetical protein